MNFVIDLHIFPFEVMFSFGQTDSNLLRSIKKMTPAIPTKEQIDLSGCDGKTIYFSSGEAVIRLPFVPTTARHFGALQHEIYHATDEFCKKMDIKRSKSDETYAYIIGYLTMKCYERLEQ